MAKKKEDKLDEAVRLAHEHGLRYNQLQKLESLGRVKIVEGQLFKITEEGYFEAYR